MEEFKLGEETTKIRIPDENVVEWIKTLLGDENNPLSSEEIDQMMSKLNFEYGRMKSPAEVRNTLDKTLRLIEKHPAYKSLAPAQQQIVKEHALRIANRETEKAKIQNTPKR